MHSGSNQLHLYLHLVVLSRAPNLQHISLQPHSVCSHLNHLTLLTDDLVPGLQLMEKREVDRKHIKVCVDGSLVKRTSFSVKFIQAGLANSV